MGRTLISYDSLLDKHKESISEEEYYSMPPYTRYRLRLSDPDKIDLRVGIQIKRRKPMPKILTGRLTEAEYHALSTEERRFIRNPARGISNFSIEQYWQLYDNQGGLCAICLQPDLKKRLSVDHSHKTGKVRGLLCSRCNMALGLIEDNEIFLEAMINYLREGI